MPQPIDRAFPDVSDRTPYLPWLLLIFIGSGCAALIYEVVWFQLLQLIVGSSAVSIGALLGTFMGGMCVGSVVLPRWVSSHRHPLRVYAALEFGIALCGLGVLFGMQTVTDFYAAHSSPGLAGVVWRGAVAALCLLPPTVLMGATLPAVARWIESTREGVATLGFLYGANIGGAVFGCLLAGFYLLRVYNLATATFVAASINLTVAAVALALAARAARPGPPAVGASDCARRRGGSVIAYVSIFLSGACALGAEVIWTRLLSLLLGGTVYTFSIILAVFLVGLGIGSSLGAAFSRRMMRPLAALGTCQLLLAGSIAWAAWQLSRSLPWWPVDPWLCNDPWLGFQLDLVRAAWAILPAACLWGASFPLALAAVAAPGKDPGRLVGQVYAANTAGAIVGATLFSIVLIRSMGTQHSQQLLIGISAMSGVMALLPVAVSARASPGFPLRSPARRIASSAALALAAGAAGGLASRVPGIPGELIAHGQSVRVESGKSQIIFKGEGMNASVAVSLLENGVRNFHVSGKIEASSEPQDMRLQRMLGHIPALFHPRPRSVLVVGCGAGVTAGSFIVHPEVERIVICEIEPLIPGVVVQYFGVENHKVITDPRVEVVYDDARHFILSTRETFDIITSDPIHPWVKGAATLYTEEYLELCKRHLNPGGIISQWVPLYQSSVEAVKSEVATIFRVFPNGSVWSNDLAGAGYDVVLLGYVEPLMIDVDRLQARLAREDHWLVAYSLWEVGFASALDVTATYAGQASDLAIWLQDAQINRDRNLRLQYLAGMGVRSRREDQIYNEMLSFRRFPESLFVASDETRAELKRRLGAEK